MTWTADEARYALGRLIALRKIRSADVEKALRDRPKEIQELRQRLAELENVGGVGRPRRTSVAKSGKAKRLRRKLSAQARSRLRLQGRYMGYVRRLTAAQKAQAKNVRQAKGWRAAIAAAKRMAKR